jgi:hypothetical protein
VEEPDVSITLPYILDGEVHLPAEDAEQAGARR